MTNLFRVSITLCIFLLLCCYGCASRPDQQIQIATEAMNQAAAEQADQYAPGDWKSAKEAWDQAQTELGKQQYAKAGASFTTAKARFQKARDHAKIERESWQKEVQNLLANINNRYAAFKAAKLTPAVRKDFQAACADIDKRMDQIKTLTEAGDYIQAKPLAVQTLQAIFYSETKLQAGGKTQ